MMTAWRQGQCYMSRHDNPPELVEALSLWSFPADFDPAQLPTGMFMCVIDEWRRIEREKKGLPPEPPKKFMINPELDIASAETIEPRKPSMTKNKLYIIATIAAAFGVCAYQAGDIPYAAGSLLVAGVISLAAWAVE